MTWGAHAEQVPAHLPQQHRHQEPLQADSASPGVSAQAFGPDSSPDERANTKRAEVTRALVRPSCHCLHAKAATILLSGMAAAARPCNIHDPSAWHLF